MKLSIEKVFPFVSEKHINELAPSAKECNELLIKATGRGNDFLGWVDLPGSVTPQQIADLNATATKLRAKCEVIVVIGIGGSYLGAKSVIDALSNSFEHLKTTHKNPIVLFAGQNIGEDYLAELMAILKDKQFGLINISKSGTTTEPAIAFRLLKKMLEEQIGKTEAKERIVAITDASKGALRKLADQEGYKTFIIPDNVGGRFSVLTPVGLLPIAVAGYDIAALLKGAADMAISTGVDVPFEKNLAEQYAATRNALYRDGKKIEILVNYHPKLHFFAEWWKQLYGESEGKEHKGIYPSAVDNTDRKSVV